MRIEVGQGLEGDITDLEAGRIIAAIKPFFKDGRYDEGIIFGIQTIIRTLGGDSNIFPLTSPAPSSRKRRSSFFDFFYLIFLFLFIVIRMLTSYGPRRSTWGYGGISGRRSGSFGGGGGSWSGGGGGFSGGGASGGW